MYVYYIVLFKYHYYHIWTNFSNNKSSKETKYKEEHYDYSYRNFITCIIAVN